MKYFLEYAKKSIKKNFLIWVEDLEFLGIWADMPFAQVFCRLICGIDGEIDNGCVMSFDEFHQKTYRVRDFETFLRGNITNDTIYNLRRLDVVKDHIGSIQMVVGGQTCGRTTHRMT